jgi:hypothetical protein
VEYVIWSSTGRRTDRLTAADVGADQASTRVLFGAGSYFRVLGVDQPTAGGPARVLLREVPESAKDDAVVDERTRQRLREALRATPVTEGGPSLRIPGNGSHRSASGPMPRRSRWPGKSSIASPSRATRPTQPTEPPSEA